MGVKNKLFPAYQLLNNFDSFLESKDNNFKLKTFGDRANRVTTEEIFQVFKLLQEKLSYDFKEMELVKSLESKTTHGDIDILIVNRTNDISDILKNKLDNILEIRRNYNITSCLFAFKEIDKNVHVDFIVSKDVNSLITKRYYYSLNDFSAIVGMIARRLNFKYGTDGFFKLFKDIKGNYHDIFITNDLTLGLKYMGFDISLYPLIKNHDDILNFILSSKLVDIDFFKSVVSRDLEAVSKRPGLNYLFNKIKYLNFKASLTDEDYYLKKYNINAYELIVAKSKDINEKTYVKSLYGGDWVIKNFDIKPGPQVGLILKAIYNKFGEGISKIPESEIINFVKESFFND